MTSPVVMLVAAEASGDVLGAGLMKALKARLGAVRFIGIGGPAMAQEGLASAFDITELSIVGLMEGLSAYPKVKARVAELADLARRDPPDVAVLIDSFGLTLRVGKALKAAMPGLPLIKYVGPQVWASRPGRARTLAQVFDHLLAIVPFDAPHYQPFDFPVTFVGNPALTIDFSSADPAAFRREIGAAEQDRILLILPGSRPSEIRRMTPPFEEAAKLLKQGRPDLHVAVVVAPTVAELVKTQIGGWPFRVHLVEGELAKRSGMKAATVALACSGTVTSEIALAGTPMVVGYRLGSVTYRLLRWLIRTPFITLINIAAGKRIIPELVQGQCTGLMLAKEVGRLLDDPGAARNQAKEQTKALQELHGGVADPHDRAAAVVGSMLTRPE